MLDLTACIVTYNSKFSLLKQTVDSFQKSTPKTQLIIHDNGSDPDYRNKLNELNTDQIINGANKGFGYGHNQGFKHTEKSKYHLVLNPDVEIPENTLEKMITFMENNQEVGLCSPKILNPDESIQMLNKREPSFFNLFARRFLPKFLQNWQPIKRKMEHYIMLDKGYESSYEVPYMSGCFMLFRKDIYEKTNGFDEDFFMYLEDADITRRVRKLSKCIYFPSATITHHWSRGSHKSLKLTWVSIKSSFIYFKKWGWKFC